ncbi:LacI family DNA-binding transcriptional regulator [Janthinobacterium fluminis]|uniref:LacI family DNA-binding transcriptional regulator n=1 Tax=Janthinobacterium fluminis TaxID=2987524 RepID=A0ABT5JYS8_9BURK|nr:LacI family DNA-binding transcriptional regulator [Janthinobacterium fluminis]MDC8756687.1 LacI family DNA-binding transcriptional regulator [Janthinobacterium fluminis]
MRKPRPTPAPPAAAKRPERRVTSYDVALLAGVSQSAVSRCFKPGASVSKATHERVMKAARCLDYIPNAAARSLITRRSNLVGVIISSLAGPEALAELSRQITQRGKRALLFTPTRENELDTILSEVWQYQVDGVIAAASLSERQVAQFARRRVPLVMFNRGAHGPAVNAVVCDQAAAARLLVSRLAEAGHRQFALIDGPQDCADAQQRLLGARMRIAELGLPVPAVVDGHGDYASGGNGIRAIIAQLGRVPDAVICGKDVAAIGCLDTARHELGINIPGKMAVAGCDAVEASAWLSHKLTTLRQPIQKMAQAAADLLSGLIDNRDAAPQQRLFNAQLVEGATARLDTPDSRDLALRLALNKHGLLTI